MASTVTKSENLLSIPDLIAKKRDGLELSPDEIKQFIEGLSNETVQDSQVGAMLMAIYTKGNLENSVFFGSLKFSFFRYDGRRNMFTDNVHA